MTWAMSLAAGAHWAPARAEWLTVTLEEEVCTVRGDQMQRWFAEFPAVRRRRRSGLVEWYLLPCELTSEEGKVTRLDRAPWWINVDAVVLGDDRDLRGFVPNAATRASENDASERLCDVIAVRFAKMRLGNSTLSPAYTYRAATVAGRPACLLDGRGPRRRSRWMFMGGSDVAPVVHVSNDDASDDVATALYTRLLEGGLALSDGPEDGQGTSLVSIDLGASIHGRASWRYWLQIAFAMAVGAVVGLSLAHYRKRKSPISQGTRATKGEGPAGC